MTDPVTCRGCNDPIPADDLWAYDPKLRCTWCMTCAAIVYGEQIRTRPIVERYERRQRMKVVPDAQGQTP